MPIRIARSAATTVQFSTPQEIIIDHTNDSIRLGNGTVLNTFTTVGSKAGVDANIIGGVLPSVVDAPTTVLDTVTTVQKTIAISAGQQAVTITNLSAGKIHFSFTTGVTTSNASFNLNEQLVIRNFNGQIFLITPSGTNNFQIDRFIKS